MRRINTAAIAVALGVVWTDPAMTQESSPSGDQLAEVPWKCSRAELTVWGENDDLRLSPGQTDWTRVSDHTITLFCGKYEDKVECPEGTDFIWVSRTGKSEVFIACYEEN